MLKCTGAPGIHMVAITFGLKGKWSWDKNMFSFRGKPVDFFAFSTLDRYPISCRTTLYHACYDLEGLGI